MQVRYTHLLHEIEIQVPKTYASAISHLLHEFETSEFKRFRKSMISLNIK